MGLILCAQKDEAVAHYSLEGLPNKVMASEYRLALPEEKVLAEQLERTQRALEARGAMSAEEHKTGRATKKVSQRSKSARTRTKEKG